jgi:predicted Zn finger-like uncharacterized protein
MDQIIACESCATKLKVRAEHAGRKVRCPKCNTVLSVPGALLEAEVLEDRAPEHGIRTRESGPETGVSRRPTPLEETGRDLDRQDDALPRFPGPKLGSLAQVARGKQLRGARILMIVLGTLVLLAGMYALFAAKTLVRNAIQAELAKRGPGFIPNPISLQQAEERGVRIVRLLAVVEMAVGAVFIALAAIIYLYPVAATVLGLVLYISMRVIVFVMRPEAMLNPFALLIMALIIIGLAKAVQSAIVYQRERDADRRRREDEEEVYG